LTADLLGPSRRATRLAQRKWQMANLVGAASQGLGSQLPEVASFQCWDQPGSLAGLVDFEVGAFETPGFNKGRSSSWGD